MRETQVWRAETRTAQEGVPHSVMQNCCHSSHGTESAGWYRVHLPSRMSGQWGACSVATPSTNGGLAAVMQGGAQSSSGHERPAEGNCTSINPAPMHNKLISASLPVRGPETPSKTAVLKP